MAKGEVERALARYRAQERLAKTLVVRPERTFTFHGVVYRTPAGTPRGEVRREAVPTVLTIQADSAREAREIVGRAFSGLRLVRGRATT